MLSAMRSIARFSTSEKYYPIKLVPPQHWVHGKYCQVYAREMEPTWTKHTSLRNQIRATYILLPQMMYYPYWVMLGQIDTAHVSVAVILGLIYVKNLFTIIGEEDMQVWALFVHRNGTEWVIAVSRSAQDRYEAPMTDELRDLAIGLSLNPKLTVIRCQREDILSTSLQEQIKLTKSFSKIFPDVDISVHKIDVLQAVVKTKNTSRYIQLTLSKNKLPEYNELINPFFSKRLIVFPQNQAVESKEE